MEHNTAQQHTITPIVFTRREAAQSLAISEPQLDALIKAGIVPHIRLGHRRLMRIPRALLSDAIIANVGKTLALPSRRRYKNAVGGCGGGRNPAAETVSVPVGTADTTTADMSAQHTGEAA
jgi:excisionase family DNA binding protein